MFVVGDVLAVVAKLIGFVLDFWTVAIVAAAILSWVPVDPYHPLVRAVRAIADLICDPIRRLVPMGNIGIDLSPLLAILFLQFTAQVLVKVLNDIAGRMH